MAGAEQVGYKKEVFEVQGDETVYKKSRDTRANSSILNQVLARNASRWCHNSLIWTFNHN